MIIFCTCLRDFGRTVRDGSFDRFILRPRGLLFQIIFANSDWFAALGHGGLGAVLFVLSANKVGISWNAVNILYYVLAVAGGVLIQGAVFLFLATLNIYLLETDSLKEIFYWDMTYNADFIYRDLYLDRHWEAAHLLRLHPVDQPMYDLTMKYILPIGYHNVNLFLLDWSSDDYGNLCFNDLLDCLYRLKYNDYLYARDYPRYTTPYSYIAIPAKLFEDTIFPYFDISMEEFREKALYDAENDIYPWQDISCDNVLYYPSLIPEVTECIEIDESTKKLIVNVMCPDYQTDKLFVHEVTIRVLSDGEYQYIGNQITYKSDIDIPSPQARIPVQRFSVDNDN